MSKEKKFYLTRRQILVNIVKKHSSLVAFVLYLILTVLIARPILQNLNSVIIGDDNDAYINPWADWWTLKALTNSNETLWQTDYLFYPQGADLTYHSFSHLNTLISLALRPLFGALPAYNLTILLNYLLNALAMFHLVAYLTGSKRAAFLAGIIFAFNSHSLYQSCHPDLVSIWAFPWLTLYLMRSVRENRAKWAFIAALFTFLGAATSTVLVVLMAIWLPLLIGYLYVTKVDSQSFWQNSLLYLVLSTIFILPLVFPLIVQAFMGENNTFLMDVKQSISADMGSIFVPHWYIWLIRGIYLGIVPFYMLLLAWGEKRKQTRFWWLFLLIAYFLSISPTPKLFGIELSVTLPWAYIVAPLLRQMYRVNILLALAFAVLVPYGWIAFSEKLNSKYHWPIFICVVVLVWLDYTSVPFPHRIVQVSPFYTDILAQESQDVIIATLPIGRQEDKRYMYYQTIHGHKMVGGHISRASEDTANYLESNPLLRLGMVDLESVPIPEDLDIYLASLANDNIVYLVLDKTLMNVKEWRTLLPRKPFYEDDLVLVYETR